MNKFNNKRFFLFIILSLVFVFPNHQAEAWSWGDLGSLASKAIKKCDIPSSEDAKSDAVPVATSLAERTAAKRFTQKEVGSCKQIFGKQVPLGSWDSVFTAVGKILIRDLTTDLVGWINGGANGQPKFVQDPGQFFGNIADQTSGKIIDSLGANGLCEPIRVSVVTSLAEKYGGGNSGLGDYNPVCTFTGARNNLENFMTDFKEGGWEGWFSMTQNDYNNADGAYLKTTLQIDNEVAKKIGIESQVLDWGKGFLSMKESVCVQKDDSGNCIKSEDKITTPGTYIENYLEQTSGTWVRQLELADEFDEIINASIGALTNSVLKKGLSFSADALSDAFNDAPGKDAITLEDIDLSCSTNITSGPVGLVATWTAETSLENSVKFTWTGDEMEVGRTGTSISVKYNFPGTKKASVTVTGKDDDGKSRTLTESCVNTVTISGTTPPINPPTSVYPPLSVSCYPESSSVSINTDIRWIAEVTGGSGTLAATEWSGTDSTSGAWTQNPDVVIPQNTEPQSNFVYKTRQYSTYGVKGASVLVNDIDPSVDPSQVLCNSFLNVTEGTTAPNNPNLPTPQ